MSVANSTQLPLPGTSVNQTPQLSSNPSASSGGPGSNSENAENVTGYVPRPKRIACTVCRRRKLRCDGKKPNCGSCARLGHDCTYNEIRKKSGPKRGYVKQLEARLAQVETLLKTQDATDSPQRSNSNQVLSFQDVLKGSNSMVDLSGGVMIDEDPSLAIPLTTYLELSASTSVPNEPSLEMGPDNSWEMIGLGLEESLPSQNVIDDLNNIYFEKISPSYPMIHKPRYYAAMNLSPSKRPAVCLRYIMWAHAAAATDKYKSLHPHFYQRARKYAEIDEMRGLGESLVTLAHAQCWNLIGSYEFKMMFFPRAWMSTGRASRLAMMMGFHRQDGIGLDVKQCIEPARDWTEREERRRTFWVAFCQDRYASIGTGWPMMVDEKDILTYLPASDEAFLNCREQRGISLSDAMSGKTLSALSSAASVAILTCHLGRNLHHLHRPSMNDRDHDLNGEFWKRHRSLDNSLLNISLSLPSHLRLPEGINEPNVIFCNMCVHTSTICLHQAAIFKAEKNDVPKQISAESKRRCMVAADQITNIMRMISHVDLSLMNPFLSFCLYVAARVFVQYLRSRSDDMAVRSSLQFLISALGALKDRNPLSQSFLVQLEFDLENSRVDAPKPGQRPTMQNCNIFKNAESNENAQTFDTNNNEVECEKQRTPVNCMSRSQCIQGVVLETALPSRQKPVTDGQRQKVPAHMAQDQVPVAYQPRRDSSFRSLGNEEMRAFALDMDMVTELSGSSDRQPSLSDYSTPNTQKSYSNSSLSPHTSDHPSPPKKPAQQPQSQAFLSTPSPHHGGTPNLTNGPSSFAEGSNPSMGNPFNFPAAWNYGQAHNQAPAQAPAQSQLDGGVAFSDPALVSSTASDFMLFDNLSWIQNESGSILDWSNWQH